MLLSSYLTAWREQGSQFTLGRKGKPCGGSLHMDLGRRRVSGGAVGGLAAPLHQGGAAQAPAQPQDHSHA